MATVRLPRPPATRRRPAARSICLTVLVALLATAMPAGDAAGALQRTMPDYDVQELGSLGGSYSVGTSVSLGANSAPEIYRLLPGLFAREDRPENYLQIGRSCSWRLRSKEKSRKTGQAAKLD